MAKNPANPCSRLRLFLGTNQQQRKFYELLQLPYWKSPQLMLYHYNQDAPCMEYSPTFGLQSMVNVGEYCIPLGPKTMKNTGFHT